MSEQKYKKAIFIFRIIVALSLVFSVALIVVIVNIENWNETISMALRISNQIIWACFFVSIFVQTVLIQKNKGRKAEDKIKALEQEIERLKNK